MSAAASPDVPRGPAGHATAMSSDRPTNGGHSARDAGRDAASRSFSAELRRCGRPAEPHLHPPVHSRRFQGAS